MNRFDKLLPNVTSRKQEQKLEQIMYIALNKWKWSYEDFCNTPIPVILSMLHQYSDEIKKKRRASKK